MSESQGAPALDGAYLDLNSLLRRLAAAEQLAQAVQAIVYDPEAGGRAPLEITRGQYELLATALSVYREAHNG